MRQWLLQILSLLLRHRLDQYTDNMEVEVEEHNIIS